MSETTAGAVNMALPPYMEEGSFGPLCAVLGAFLMGNSDQCNSYNVPTGFIPDLMQGTKATELIKEYQFYSGLTPDGGVGPDTREELRQDDFDIDVIALALGGTTVFVQPDGKKISWSPETGQVELEDVAPAEAATAVGAEPGTAFDQSPHAPVDEGAADSALPPGDGEAHVTD